MSNSWNLRKKIKSRFQDVDKVGLLPSEEVALGLAAEVAVGRGLAIDRLVELQVRADAARGQPAELLDTHDRPLDRAVLDRAGAVRIDVQGERLRYADRIGELDRAALGKPGGDDVLCQIAADVRR